MNINSNYFYEQFYSFIEQTKGISNEIFYASIDSIKNDYNYNHYLCKKCLKFPFVKFCKDRKSVRLTCSCFNNKKVLIEELFRIFSIKDNVSSFLSDTNLNINIENALICKKHNKKFKGFSKFLLNNFCEDCPQYKYMIDENDIIRFDDIKIEEKKLENLIEKIKDNNENDISGETSEKISISSSNIELIENKDNYFEKLTEEEGKRNK